MIEAAERSRFRARTARPAAEPIAFLRRFDWVLLAAAFGLIGYGLWVVAGITRFDVPGDEDYYVVRQAIAAGLGLAALVVAAFVPLDVAQRHWRLLYGATLGLMGLVYAAADTGL